MMTVSCHSIWLSLLQVEAKAMPKGPKNPHGNAFTSKETELQTESKAQRTANSSTGRVWLVKNPSHLHPYSGLSYSVPAKTLMRSVYLDFSRACCCHTLLGNNEGDVGTHALGSGAQQTVISSLSRCSGVAAGTPWVHLEPGGPC